MRTRRRVLAGTGTVVFGGLAGCSGDGDGESGDDGGSSGGDGGNDGAGGGGSSGSPSLSVIEHENRGDLFFVDFIAENQGTSDTGEAQVTVWWLDDEGNRFGEDVFDANTLPRFPAGDRWSGAVRRSTSYDIEPADYEIQIDAEPEPPEPDAPVSVTDASADFDEEVLQVTVDTSRIEEWGSVSNSITVGAILYDGEGRIRNWADNRINNAVEIRGLDTFVTDIPLGPYDWIEDPEDLGDYEAYVVEVNMRG